MTGWSKRGRHRRWSVAMVVGATLALAAPWHPMASGGLLGGLVDTIDTVIDDVHPYPPVVVDQRALCSEDDRPETGLQGDVPRADQESGRAKQGYNCGLSLVGHTVIERDPGSDDQARTGNANMAWAGDCAYVSGPGALFGEPRPEADWGVAVVDVSDPAAPVHVSTLRTPGALATSETLHAVDNGERAVLVVGEYGNVGKTDVPMDIYDVTDCATPTLLQTVVWPQNIHNLAVSGNGRYVFATQPLQVLDLDPLFDDDPGTGAVHLGNLERELPMPLVPIGPVADLDDALPDAIRKARTSGDLSSLSHEAHPSVDGTRLYIGGVTVQSEALSIVDLTDWLTRDAANRPAGPPRIVSQRTGRGHSVRTATVGDGDHARRFVLHSEESVFGLAKGCLPEDLNPFAGAAQPYLTEITDERDPETIAHFGLEINEHANCLAQLDSGVDASVHYHDVDDPDDTTFVMASMWNAGLRVFDIRNPEHPVEVAYFNPADVGIGEVVLDQAWGHVRYVAATGHIWFATASGGFWVVEIAPQVRDHLGLDDGGVARRDGHPGTAGAERVDAAFLVDVTPYYCTLGSVT